VSVVELTLGARISREHCRNQLCFFHLPLLASNRFLLHPGDNVG
jgi:hypothetical protein